jgi:hypothetical protein
MLPFRPATVNLSRADQVEGGMNTFASGTFGEHNHRGASIAAALLSTLLLIGCQTAGDRIDEHRSEFAALDPATQRAVQRGIVEPGYTTDMAYIALGKPTQMTTEANGNLVWLYRREPVPAYNETIQSGFSRRIVYDPVKRTDDVIIEPVDPKAFPNKVPHTLRLTFQNGRLVNFQRVPSF